MHTTRSHGFKIAYEVTGHGRPLVLHPGMFQVGSHWTDAGYTSALTATHMVIAIDPLGLGGSDGPQDPRGYMLARRAESVTAVLDDIGVEQAAFWGYSLGALTGYAVAVHAPERLTRLVAGAFDPINGFRSAIEPILLQLGLSAETDPYPWMLEGSLAHPQLAAVIHAANPARLRANFEAFCHEPGVHAELASVDIPMLMYAGTADPWHDPMQTFAERTGKIFFSLAGADHIGGWSRVSELLARVLPFLGGDRSGIEPSGS